MFFLLSKLLYYLILPLNWVVILLGVSLLIKRPSWKKKLRVAAFIILIIISNPFLANRLLRAWEPDFPQQTKGAKTAVILTGMLDMEVKVPDQVMFNNNSERLLEPIRLYHKEKINKIIITGGAGSVLFPENIESLQLEKLAIELGVNPNDLQVETQSDNTHENALFVKKLISDEAPVLLITSAFHMRRAAACFKKEQINFIAWPVDYRSTPVRYTPEQFIPSAHAIITNNTLIKEWVGFIMYRVMGYL